MVKAEISRARNALTFNRTASTMSNARPITKETSGVIAAFKESGISYDRLKIFSNTPPLYRVSESRVKSNIRRLGSFHLIQDGGCGPGTANLPLLPEKMKRLPL